MYIKKRSKFMPLPAVIEMTRKLVTVFCDAACQWNSHFCLWITCVEVSNSRPDVRFLTFDLANPWLAYGQTPRF